jgi:CO dehydrogenase nickel-insertion accessory protein CooC1
LFGGIFNMTPQVNDIVERYGVDGRDGVKLLVMGTIKTGNSGCMCGANALLRVLVQHLLIQRKEVLIMDMEAGVEHLGRGTAEFVDTMLVVTDATVKALETAKIIFTLARSALSRIFSWLGIRSEMTRKRNSFMRKRHNYPFGLPTRRSISARSR